MEVISLHSNGYVSFIFISSECSSCAASALRRAFSNLFLLRHSLQSE
nr:MAG TPA: hypothetical protein [Caudoviricetes sp.]